MTGVTVWALYLVRCGIKNGKKMSPEMCLKDEHQRCRCDLLKYFVPHLSSDNRKGSIANSRYCMPLLSTPVLSGLSLKDSCVI